LGEKLNNLHLDKIRKTYKIYHNNIVNDTSGEFSSNYSSSILPGGYHKVKANLLMPSISPKESDIKSAKGSENPIAKNVSFRENNSSG
jgi:hypothetical protein